MITKSLGRHGLKRRRGGSPRDDLGFTVIPIVLSWLSFLGKFESHTGFLDSRAFVFFTLPKKSLFAYLVLNLLLGLLHHTSSIRLSHFFTSLPISPVRLTFISLSNIYLLRHYYATQKKSNTFHQWFMTLSFSNK